jgi:hypothetical protein
VLSLKLTIEDLQKLQNWLVHTIVKQECYLKHFDEKVQKGDVLYCIYSETDELKYSIDYMIRKEYYFNLKRMKKYILLYPEMRT